jgi:hypothetical protein
MPDLVLPSRRAQVLWNLKNRVVRWRADLVATVSETSATAISDTWDRAHSCSS